MTDENDDIRPAGVFSCSVSMNDLLAHESYVRRETLRNLLSSPHLLVDAYISPHASQQGAATTTTTLELYVPFSSRMSRSPYTSTQSVGKYQQKIIDVLHSRIHVSEAQPCPNY